jgi:hypothetical protein
VYEREYLTSMQMQAVFVGFGVGLAFTMIGLFVPGLGILSVGLFTPLIIFFLLGGLCIFAGFMELKNQIKESRNKRNRVLPSESTIVVQSGMDSSATLAIGLGFFGMGTLFTLLSLFVPEGVLEYGMQSDMFIMLSIGGPFALIGFGFFVFGIPELRTVAIYKKLYKDSSMFTTTGTYLEIPAERIEGGKTGKKPDGSGTLIYKYQDETGITRIGETYDTFTVEELEWFKNQGTIKVRCKGKYSVILEYPMSV